MMTYIELFDNMAIKNICSSLVKAPDKVVFVGSQRRKMNDAIEIYDEIFEGKIAFEYKVAKSNSLSDMISVISSIVENEEECAFDTTGGDDLFLVALGAVFEKYKDRGLQLHYFNLNTCNYYDCDGDGNTVFDSNEKIVEHPLLTVSQNARIYGGIVKKTATPERSDFTANIGEIWDVCRVDTVMWNVAVSAFCDYITKENSMDDGLSYSFEYDDESLINYIDDVIEGLLDKKLLKSFTFVPGFNMVTIEFANELIKECFTAAGKVLELLVYETAKKVRFTNGKGFDDIQTGIVLDWDGVIQEKQADEYNEIDVIMMKNFTPIFVSCKNGQLGIDELYKFNSVANRFGTSFAKKVLVCNEIYDIVQDPDNKGKVKKICGEDYKARIRNRAKDMNIALIENVNYASESDLVNALTTYTVSRNLLK